jgi:hypothetical protein
MGRTVVKIDEVNDREVGPPDAGIGDATPPGRVEPLPREQRAARGRAARESVPRSSHGKWGPTPDRRDPVDVLEEQAATRVPDLVPIRYGRMLVSPFTFYRGAAAVMAADLAPFPHSGLIVQLCGDGHLCNFGGFAAPDRRLVFSLNDFDETLPGPFEWDVKRLVASFEIAGRDQGFEAARRAAVNSTLGRSYREAMTSFAQMRTLDLWYLRLDVDDVRKRWASVSSRSKLRFLDRGHVKSRLKDNVRAFDKLTRIVEGRPRFVSHPPLIVPLDDLMTAAQHAGFNKWLGRAIHAIGVRCPLIAGSSSIGSDTCRAPARWWASAAWVPEHGSHSSSATTTAIPWYCRSRRRSRRCSSASWARVASPTMASASWRGN